jgi:hypothetical protein
LIGDEVGVIDCNKTQIDGLEICMLDRTELISDEAEFIVSKEAIFGWTAIDFSGKITVTSDGVLSLFGNNVLDSMVVNSNISLQGENHIHYLEANPGAIVSMIENKSQYIDLLDLNGSEGKLVEIRSMTNSNAIIAYDKHEKLCFDYLKVVDIDISSESIFNAGPHSELLGSDDWLAMECDDVLFPAFVVENPCAHGLTLFTDQSTGPITSWAWNFGDAGSSTNTSNDRNVNHQYLTAGTYEVTLTISSSVYSVSYTTEIEVLPSGVANTIVQNGFVLASQQSADAYQWYRNGEIIAGKTNRTFVFDEPASYQLLTTVDDCNYFTEPFIILGEQDQLQQTFAVYPNPAVDKVTIQFKDQQKIHRLSLMNSMGQGVMAIQTQEEKVELDVAGLSVGIYIVEVDGRKQRLMVQR